MALVDLFDDGYQLAWELQKLGPTSTTTMDAAKEFLSRYGKANLVYGPNPGL
jgi:hypothetical protein